MKLERLALNEALGHILCHNISAEGGRALRKGKALAGKDIETLRELGHEQVYVARLEPGDVEEDQAAERIARAIVGPGLKRSGPATGRVNLRAEAHGLLRVDLARLDRINSLDGVTLATHPRHTTLRAGKMAATLKILPYALPEQTVRVAEAVGEDGPVLHLTPLSPRRVALVLCGAVAAQARVVQSFRRALVPRLEALAAGLDSVDFVAVEEGKGEDALAQVLGTLLREPIDLLILAGETAIQDRYDILPRAVERAGAEIEAFGAPVDPGNLLLLAYHGLIPILGAPGCARSPQPNVIDLVLHRLLAGDRLGQADLLALGHGGLMKDVPERPYPRSQVE